MAQLKVEEMLNLAENAVKASLRKGADEAETYVYEGVATAVGIEHGQIAHTYRNVDTGLGIRSIVNKAVGFSYTNVVNSNEAMDQVALKSVLSARASKPDANWLGLAPKRQYASVKGGFDQKIVETSSDDLVKIAALMLESAENTDKRALCVQGGSGASHYSVAVANSNGIEATDTGTFLNCSLATVGNEAGEVTPVCFEFNLERMYRIDPEWVGREAARQAISALKAKRMETENTNVIFVQTALQDIFAYTVINAVKADVVQRNQSALKDKVGEKVASDNMTIYDDGLLADGLRTSKFDGEGSPQQKTSILDKGVLRSFIYDNYTSKKEGRESTGNASRAAYLSTPGIDCTNFHLVPGTASSDELLKEADNGLLVYLVQGAHSSNPASGDFSVVASPAWRIEKGQMTYPVKGAMLSGNVFDLLKNITVLANNERKVGQLVAPWVLAENVKVVGK